MLLKRRLINSLNMAILVAIFVLISQIFLSDYLIRAPLISRNDSSINSESFSNLANYDKGIPPKVSVKPLSIANSQYTWSNIEISDYSDYLAVVRYELSKYSQEFLDSIGLDRIYLVNNITDYDGRKSLGFTETVSGNIFLSALDSKRAFSNDSRSTIHHEIGHLVMIKSLGFKGLESGEWQDFNAKENSYDPGVTASNLFPASGFVSSYAMSSVAEDMAEVYAFMMTDGYNNLLSEQIKSDVVLKQKYDFINKSIENLNLDEPWQLL